ncbi:MULTISPECIES: heptaprenylglyceryl phosphate synthase [Heyndrickxia]|uniref:heptaprenylglyceryl phosphate synthase n=1 Tax=Heyndrickxia TaxID=2837504 RepID=UPI000D7305CD|nr:MULTISPECIES: heptaprenylglyceryl phosphate synthase [Heyndrickxia]AWP38836.1 heptaprenylglyceryl phosphate synthase [Heyndrickxia coagulans]MBQ4911784.1 heptaprenylglyceryl phosphate synthase [Heyndrickxia faecalis]MED4838924.1 heptaprenylglyceryl phosphate synthase [Weizmannia sp. CD-2023]MED4899600.1 heptaprenylglyceryl phosphate synthase [Weizmannia sp. CD-2023]NMH83322.1 heptaprenylglyceryl phosphate synthase [Heyndrickxia coagulans]
MYDVREWRHAFKLDPNKDISEKDLEKVCESGTDAVIIGGTDGVTLDNTLQLMSRVRRYAVPCCLEVSDPDAIAPAYDLYLIPAVLNSQNTTWITGAHHKAVKAYGEWMNWNEIVMEGYCILNPDCKAAQLAEAATGLDDDDVLAYASMAEHMFKFPVFYLEYSGTYGDPKLVEKVKTVLEDTVLFYGGGIRTAAQAAEMARAADVVVVGNVVYEDIHEAVKTVRVVKQTGL